jgi:hypothetical protein
MGNMCAYKVRAGIPGALVIFPSNSISPLMYAFVNGPLKSSDSDARPPSEESTFVPFASQRVPPITSTPTRCIIRFFLVHSQGSLF